MNLSLGSLFDGSGGFPLAGSLCGIEPKWASEVEPYPIAVTRERFLNMKHLGDISKINGAEVEPVDIITFGSPCQDLSVAGKRAGLKHEDNGDEETTRSGLFMEAVRIIKEMRKATNGEYPKFALWENVPGAFSSNKGEDFRIVLEELIKVVEPSAVMPAVPQKGWAYADSYCGDGWSLAYRVFDAQYWGVPQRRRRIYLVADFRDQRAREILFERDGLRGYFEKGRTPWQTVTRDAENSIGATDCEGTCYALDQQGGKGGANYAENVMPTLCSDSHGTPHAVAYPYLLKIRSGCEGGGKGALIQEDKSATLATNNDQTSFQPVIAIDKESYTSGSGFDRAPGIAIGGPCATSQTSGTPHAVCYAVENHPADSRVDIEQDGRVQTLTSRMGTGGGNVPMVMEPFSKSRRAKSVDDFETWKHSKVSNTLNTFDNGDVRAVDVVVEAQPVYCLQGNGIDRADTAGCNGKGWKEDTSYTLNTIDRPAVAYALDRASFNQGQNAKYDFEITDSGINSTLTAKGPSAVAQPILHASKASFFMKATEGVADTLVATDYKDPQLIAYPADLHDFIADHNADAPHQQDQLQVADGISRPLVAATHGAAGHHTKTVIYEPPHYIVRRLTPTECARLQGFADKWGHFDNKDHFTEEELRFWQEVRDTYDTVIKGKNPEDLKTYTEKQMLTWYNKLHTDSSEYKMWGNGIALPTALYCMQGISEVLTKAKRSAWLNDLLGD